MAEAFRAEGTAAGRGEETEEVLVEVFHEDQGLGPKVDFCFFKQVVFHLMCVFQMDHEIIILSQQPSQQDWESKGQLVPLLEQVTQHS